MRVFAHIAQRYDSAAESTSLLSSVASLAITRNYNIVEWPKEEKRILGFLTYTICVLKVARYSFQGQYLPTTRLSVNYVAISKDLEKTDTTVVLDKDEIASFFAYVKCIVRYT